VDFGQSRLSGFSLGAFIVYPEESDCVPAVRRPKLETETSLIVHHQYDRLSQQQLSLLMFQSRPTCMYILMQYASIKMFVLNIPPWPPP